MNKAIERFKSFVMDSIVPEGYSIGFSDLRDEDLDKLIELAEAIKDKRREEMDICIERAWRDGWEAAYVPEKKEEDKFLDLEQEMKPFFGRVYINDIYAYTLEGLDRDQEDYYYIMRDMATGIAHKYSCVGTLESYGFSLAIAYI